MAKLVLRFIICISILSFTALNSVHAINVKYSGTVSDSLGAPAAKVSVYSITHDSLYNPMLNVVLTDSLGNYEDSVNTFQSNGILGLFIVSCYGDTVEKLFTYSVVNNDFKVNFIHCPNSNTYCNPNFTFNSISNDKIQFIANTSNYKNGSVLWSFGDSLTDTTRQPVHKYGNPGNYNVCLTVNSINCTKTFCDSIEIKPFNCSAFIHFNRIDSIVRFKDTATIMSAPIRDIAWDFGDGSTSKVMWPTHTYKSYGNYLVTLTITDTNGCIAIDQTVINIPCNYYGIKPVLNVTTEGDKVCLKTAPYDSSSSGFWAISPQSSPQILDTVNYRDTSWFNNTPKGFYKICLSLINSSACQIIQCTTIYVGGSNELCHAQFVFHESSSKKIHFTNNSIPYKNVLFSWDFGDSATSNLRNPVHQYSGSRDYDITLVMHDTITNCIDTAITSYKQNVGYFLSGLVFENSTGVLNTTDRVKVNLLVKDTSGYSKTGYRILQTDTSASGLFRFEHLESGSYFLKAVPFDSLQTTANFVPTYYPSNLLWKDATSIVLNGANSASNHITIKSYNRKVAPGAISGNLIYNGTKPAFSLNGYYLYAIDSSGNVASFATSDSMGNFNIKGLSFGNYTVVVDIAGLNSSPVFVEVNAQNYSLKNLNFLIDDVQIKGVVLYTGAIDELEKFKVYPNPTNHFLNIASNKYDKILSVRILDVSGNQLVARGEVENSNLLLDIRVIPNGIHILQVETENSYRTVRIIKTK